MPGSSSSCSASAPSSSGAPSRAWPPRVPGAIRQRRAPWPEPAAARPAPAGLNATSPARVAGLACVAAGNPGAGKASRTSASPRATPGAARLDPFGTAAASYLSGRAGTVLAAVYDIGTGRTWDLGHGGPQAEASVVKLDILETLLAERGQGSSIGPVGQ